MRHINAHRRPSPRRLSLLGPCSQLIQPFTNKAYCKGWGTIYVTDDLFDNGNPWDDPPTFWTLLVQAAANIPTVESCGFDGIKVLVPLLGSDPAGEFP